MAPAPLRIVLTTVVGIGPAAFGLVFPPAIADATPTDPAVNAAIVIAIAATLFFDDICMSSR